MYKSCWSWVGQGKGGGGGPYLCALHAWRSVPNRSCLAGTYEARMFRHAEGGGDLSKAPQQAEEELIQQGCRLPQKQSGTHLF